MPKFLAVHPLQAPATLEEVAPIAKRAKAASSVDAYWVCSWCQLDEAGKITKLFCQWNASDSLRSQRSIASGGSVSDGGSGFRRFQVIIEAAHAQAIYLRNTIKAQAPVFS
jgi:hypothetical protein